MKRVTLILEDELHKKAKIKAIQDDTSFKEYVIQLIKKDLQIEKE